MDDELPIVPLTGADYFRLPFTDLVNRPDYSERALRNVLSVCVMKNDELENLISNGRI